MEALKLMKIDTSITQVLGIGMIYETIDKASSIKQILDGYITADGRKYFSVVFATKGKSRFLFGSLTYNDNEYDIIFEDVSDVIISSLSTYLDAHPYYFITVGYFNSNNEIITFGNHMFKNDFFINDQRIQGINTIKFTEKLLTEIRRGKHEEVR